MAYWHMKYILNSSRHIEINLPTKGQRLFINKMWTLSNEYEFSNHHSSTFQTDPTCESQMQHPTYKLILVKEKSSFISHLLIAWQVNSQLNKNNREITELVLKCIPIFPRLLFWLVCMFLNHKSQMNIWSQKR